MESFEEITPSTIINIHGYPIVIDEEDLARVNQYKWTLKYLIKTGAYFRRYLGHGKYDTLHRFLIGAKSGEFVDHVNGNTLDNRKANLRLCTISQNGMNSSQRPGKSGITGVGIHQGKYVVKFKIHGKEKYFGRYRYKESAIAAVEFYTWKYHGAFSRIHSRGLAYEI